MAGWTYRVSKQNINGAIIFALREFYPNKQGKLTSWTSDEITPIGRSVDDLRHQLILMLAALEDETIDIGDYGNGVGESEAVNNG